MQIKKRKIINIFIYNYELINASCCLCKHKKEAKIDKKEKKLN